MFAFIPGQFWNARHDLRKSKSHDWNEHKSIWARI